MSAVGPILFDSTKHDLHYFGDKEFTIGRSADSSLEITSKVISRKQCSIKLSEGNVWEIQDLSSFKSTRVNDKPLAAMWQKLNNGDSITFQSYQESEFIFYTDESFVPRGKKRRAEEPPCDENSDKHSSKLDVSKLLAEKEELIRKNQLLEKKFQEANENLNDKQKCLEATQTSLELTQQYLTETQKSLEEVEAEKTTLALQCFDEKSTKESLLLQLQNYIDQLKECETELQRVSQEKESQVSLENKEEIYNDERKSTSCIEYNALKEELKRAHEEIAARDSCLADQINERQILFSKLSDILEQELSCSVCNEIMFQATILQCRHTLCSKCLNVWKARKKDCPFCRTKIKSEVTPLVLDNLIDKLADFIGADFKKKRDDVRRERSNSSQRYTSPHRSARNDRSRNRRNPRNVRVRSNIDPAFIYVADYSHSSVNLTIDLTS